MCARSTQLPGQSRGSEAIVQVAGAGGPLRGNRRWPHRPPSGHGATAACTGWDNSTDNYFGPPGTFDKDKCAPTQLNSTHHRRWPFCAANPATPCADCPAPATQTQQAATWRAPTHRRTHLRLVAHLFQCAVGVHVQRAGADLLRWTAAPQPAASGNVAKGGRPKVGGVHRLAAVLIAPTI